MSEVQHSHQKVLIRKCSHLRPTVLKQAPKLAKWLLQLCSMLYKELLHALLSIDKNPVAFLGQIIHKGELRVTFICFMIKRTSWVNMVFWTRTRQSYLHSKRKSQIDTSGHCVKEDKTGVKESARLLEWNVQYGIVCCLYLLMTTDGKF